VSHEGEERDFDELSFPEEELAPLGGSGETLDFGGPEESPEGLLEPAEVAEEGAVAAAGFGAAAMEAETAGEPEEAPEEDESEEETRKGPGLFDKLTRTSPYVVLLGIAALAMIIATLCMVFEWGRYDFRTRPTQTGMAPAAQSAPPSTTATA
jgi:hypothetical protein